MAHLSIQCCLFKNLLYHYILGGNFQSYEFLVKVIIFPWIVRGKSTLFFFSRNERRNTLAGEINFLPSVQMKLHSVCSAAYVNSRLKLGHREFSVPDNICYTWQMTQCQNCSNWGYVESRNSHCFHFLFERKHH